LETCHHMTLRKGRKRTGDYEEERMLSLFRLKKVVRTEIMVALTNWTLFIAWILMASMGFVRYPMIIMAATVLGLVVVSFTTWKGIRTYYQRRKKE